MMKAPPIPNRKTAAGSGKQARPAAMSSGARRVEPIHPMQSYPHGRQIGRLLGRAFEANAELDRDGCARAGVPAFTEAGRTHFAEADPPLAVAAHEAAHVLQQTGATRDMGLGAEGHAWSVEERVTGGQEARDLIGPQGQAVGAARLDYTFIGKSQQKATKWHAKRHLRVSDDGHMAVGLDNSDHYFWAEDGLLSESNGVLAKAKSRIQLKTVGDELSGPAPDGSGIRTLHRVEPFDEQTKTGGDKMLLWADCDRAAFTVMGTKGSNPGSVKGPQVGGVYTTPAMPGAEMMTASSDPQAMRDEVLAQLPGVGTFADYKKLKPKDRDKVDAQAGINRHAMPKIGEAYTTAGDLSSTEEHWTYHWGAVVMTSGGDRVTLENFSISDRKAKNTEWSFKMYGSAAKPGQTFHEQQVETDHHGDVPVTIGVRNRP